MIHDIPPGLVSCLYNRLPQPNGLSLRSRPDGPPDITLDFTVLDGSLQSGGPLTISQGDTIVSIARPGSGPHSYPGVAINYSDGRFVECVDVSSNGAPVIVGLEDLTRGSHGSVRVVYAHGDNYFTRVFDVDAPRRPRLFALSSVIARLIKTSPSPEYIHSQRPLNDALAELGFSNRPPVADHHDQRSDQILLY